MKIQVRSDDHVYEVEVGDLHARPIVVTIADEQYEVWPDATLSGAAPPPPDTGRAATATPSTPPAPPIPPPAGTHDTPPAGNAPALRYLHAPLPGVVVAVQAQPGQQIAAGQEVCVLEAMKMQNTIRAQRAGQVAAVHVTVGQQVQHNAVLIEYAD